MVYMMESTATVGKSEGSQRSEGVFSAHKLAEHSRTAKRLVVGVFDSLAPAGWTSGAMAAVLGEE